MSLPDEEGRYWLTSAEVASWRALAERQGEHEEWRCGTCAYWEKEDRQPQPVLGQCSNNDVQMRASAKTNAGIFLITTTSFNFGCRFWSAKSLKDKGVDIPIACHNEGYPISSTA